MLKKLINFIPCGKIWSIICQQFHKGNNYRTLNVHRFAISSYHVQVNGEKVGKHELVKRRLKALYNARIAQPRYNSQCEVDVACTLPGWLVKTWALLVYIQRS